MPVYTQTEIEKILFFSVVIVMITCLYRFCLLWYRYDITNAVQLYVCKRFVHQQEVEVKPATTEILRFISQPCQRQHHMFMFVFPAQYLLLL